MSNEGLGASVLPFWAATAFVARCARRCAQRYIEDHAEPNAARAAVQEAILLAEFRAGLGGDPASQDAVEIEGRFFDHYDIEALSRALDAYHDAALNTFAELNDSESRRNLAAIDLANCALWAAFTRNEYGAPLDLSEVLNTVQEGEANLLPYAEADLFLLRRLCVAESWADEDGVTAATFNVMMGDC